MLPSMLTRALSSRINAKNLLIELSKNLKEKPDINSEIPFGSCLTDYKLEIDWSEEDGWSEPRITPYSSLALDARSSVFQFCTGVFEGMKCYSNEDKDLMLFRPQKNMERMKTGCKASGLPDFDGDDFLECIRQLVLLEKDWVPTKRKHSLYIRPTMIGTSPDLIYSKPTQAKLFCVISPVGPYFPGGFKPVSLYCNDSIVRAWPGGNGNKKVGANYAPGIHHASLVKEKGHDQILWLTNNYVTEAGAMNFFLFWVNQDGKQELITSPLDSVILPGVTRDSILSLTSDWGDFLVTERRFTIDEVAKAANEGRIIEAFGAGTACILSPVKNLSYQGKDYKIPLQMGTSGVLTHRLVEQLLDIQHGVEPHPWNYSLIQNSFEGSIKYNI